MARRRNANFRGLKGQVGYADNSDLNGVTGNGGHYVYIRKVRKDGMCIVSTVTSLEDSNHVIKTGKMAQLRNGNIYAIPKNDGNFSRWSGVNKSTHEIHISKIRNPGVRTFKKRHRFIIGKNK